MSIVPVAPLVPKDWDVIFGEDNHKMAVNKCVIKPSTSSQTWTGGGKNTVTDTTTPTWAVDIDYAQDWDNPDSFSAFLFANAGEKVELEFRLKSDGAGWAAMVNVSPGEIGGAINAFATASISLGIDGTPTRLPAVTP